MDNGNSRAGVSFLPPAEGAQAWCHAVLAALPGRAAILDPHGQIIAVNEPWRHFETEIPGGDSPAGKIPYGDRPYGDSPAENRTSLRGSIPDTDYLGYCECPGGQGFVAGAGTGIRAVLEGRESSFSLEYAAPALRGQCWYLLQVTALVVADWRGALIQHLDIDARVLAARQSARHSRSLAAVVNFRQQLVEREADIDGLMASLPATAMDMLEADGAALLLIENNALVYRWASGISTEMLYASLPVTGSFYGEALRHNRVWLRRDGSADSTVIPYSENACPENPCQEGGGPSLLAAPFYDGSEPVGVLELRYRQNRHFHPGDISALELMAASVGNVLQRRSNVRHLRESEEQYRHLFYVNPMPMMIFDVETLNILAVNDAALSHYGYSREDFLGRTVANDLSDDENSRLQHHIGTLLAEGAIHLGLCEACHRDGRPLDIDVTWHPVSYGGRNACLVIAKDVTEDNAAERRLQRVNRAQRMLSDCNSALFRAADEASLLKEIADIALYVGEYCFAWIGFAEQDKARSVRVAVRAGLEGFDNNIGELTLSWDENSPTGRGITGQTIRLGQAVICQDLATAPAAPQNRGRAEAFGLRSVLSLPLRGRDGVFGLIALYSNRDAGFPEDEIALCQELADNLAYGIEHLREVRERQSLEAAVFKVASGVSSATGPQFFADLSASVADTLGAQLCAISRRYPDDPKRMVMVAGVHADRDLSGCDYRLDDAPCRHAVAESEYVIERDVRECFPDAELFAQTESEAYVGLRLDSSEGQMLGLMCVAFDHPLRNRAFVVSTLRIFAARAAAELEREIANANLYEQAALLDKAQDAIIVLDLDFRITYWNRGAENLYGWDREQVIGIKLDPTRGEGLSSVDEAKAVTLREGEWRGQLNHRHRDGSALTLEAHWSLVRNDNNQPRAIFCIHSDITQKQALATQLQQSQRLESLGQLMGGMAHDFNNLLTVILGNAELLAEELDDNPSLAALANMICNASQRGADLTRRLLSVARRQSLAPGQIDVNALLADMESLLSRTLRGNIRMVVSYLPDAWPALVDQAQLESAVINLCINARDAMPDGGELTIKTDNYHLAAGAEAEQRELEPGDYLMLQIVDTGVGVLPEHLPRLFDPFFTTKDKDKGTGLGLSMVYGFAKQSRGDITIESRPGMGTTVTLLLPRAESQEPVVDSQWPSEVEKAWDNAVVLVVEDEELVRTHAANLLRGAGYQVLEAANGQEGLDIVRREPHIDLLFTDVIMPGGMTGPELVRAVRALRPGLRVLYTSGYTENALVDEYAADADLLLLDKPYRHADLMAKIRQALQ